MSRLVAFGCSYTYGQGLSDCFNEKGTHGPNTSKYAWPNVLSNLMNLDCVNFGLPGASNKTIWYHAIRQEFKKDDIVIFLWTHIERYAIILENGKMMPIGVWSDGKIADTYFRFFQNEVESNLDLNLRMNHLYLYLDSLGIKSYHAFAVGDQFKKSEFNKSNILDTDFHKIRGKHPLASDKKHPGESAQQEFAECLYRELKEKRNEIKI